MVRMRIMGYMPPLQEIQKAFLRQHLGSVPPRAPPPTSGHTLRGVLAPAGWERGEWAYPR
jgi:hypothetical protein